MVTTSEAPTRAHRQLQNLRFLEDLRTTLTYLSDEGKQDLKAYGGMAGATVGVLVRKTIELEQQGAGSS